MECTPNFAGVLCNALAVGVFLGQFLDSWPILSNGIVWIMEIIVTLKNVFKPMYHLLLNGKMCMAQIYPLMPSPNELR